MDSFMVGIVGMDGYFGGWISRYRYRYTNKRKFLVLVCLLAHCVLGCQSALLLDALTHAPFFRVCVFF